MHDIWIGLLTIDIIIILNIGLITQFGNVVLECQILNSLIQVSS